MHARRTHISCLAAFEVLFFNPRDNCLSKMFRKKIASFIQNVMVKKGKRKPAAKLSQTCTTRYTDFMFNKRELVFGFKCFYCIRSFCVLGSPVWSTIVDIIWRHASIPLIQTIECEDEWIHSSRSLPVTRHMHMWKCSLCGWMIGHFVFPKYPVVWWLHDKEL